MAEAGRTPGTLNVLRRCASPPGARQRSLVLALAAAVVLSACGGGDSELLQPLIDLSGPQYRGQEISPERIAELERALARYQDEIEETVRRQGELSVFYKSLGVAYLEEGMFGLAAETLMKAAAIDATNPVLFYFIGVASAQQALASIDDGVQAAHHAAAEQAYARAIDIDPTYVDALYALAVLYLYEMDRAPDAEGYIDRVLAAEPGNIDAMFVRAALMATTGRPERAIDQYQIIISSSSSEERRERARQNSNELEARR